MILKYKEAHGSGENLTYPDQQQIEDNMQGYDEQTFIDIYIWRWKSHKSKELVGGIGGVWFVVACLE